jgi:L-fucose mutarotase/ribose pyranase (RbsD/FucU family)
MCRKKCNRLHFFLDKQEIPDNPINNDKYRSGTRHRIVVKRFAFYKRCKEAFTVIMTGESRTCRNIILKKEIIPLGKKM